MDSPTATPSHHAPKPQRRVDHHEVNDSSLRRLRLVGVVLPAVLIVATQVARPLVLDPLWPDRGDEIAGCLTVLGAIVFGLMMFRLIGQLVEDDRARSAMAERDRIARELHDSLAQVLGATNLRLQALGYRPDLPDDVRGELDDVAGECREAYADVREAILGLREGPGSGHGFLEGLEVYAERFTRQSGIDTHVESHLTQEPNLTPQREVQVIRIVQEALTNARKHSGARRARIVVADDAGWATFTVEDDGAGFDPGECERLAPRDTHGFGLSSMRERAELVGGRLTLTSRPGAGTRVTIAVPHASRPGAVPVMRLVRSEEPR